MAVLSTRSLEAPPSDARLVADACLKAAAELGFSKEELGEIVGRHRTSLERSGLEPSSKEGQLGLLFLRVARSLDALMGADLQLMRHWLEQPNAHLAGQCRPLLFSVKASGALLPISMPCVANPDQRVPLDGVVSRSQTARAIKPQSAGPATWPNRPG